MSGTPRTYKSCRDALRCTGPDTEEFLQGQLSQEVSDLTDKESAWSFLLNPNGKLVVWLRVTRIAKDHYLLDMEEGWGQLAFERLERFKIRVECHIEATQLQVVSILGEGAKKMRGELPSAEIASDTRWPSLEGFDLLGESSTLPSGCEIGTQEEYECLRISYAIPRMGAELMEGMIPAETNLVARSVSFTKGCYTGQELIARLDSRGNKVPRNLCRVLGNEVFTSGAEIQGLQGTVGFVTSAAHSVAGTIGLGYVSRSFEIPGRATIGDSSVQVESAFT